MLCTCIYFAEIGYFDGDDMSSPPLNPGVDPDDDQGMLDAEDHQEVGARHGQLDARYRMELGDQLSALIIEAGIRPAHYRDIQGDDRLLHMWRGLPRDMYSLMRHVVGVMTTVM